MGVAPNGHQPVLGHLGERSGAERCRTIGPSLPGKHRLGRHEHRGRQAELVQHADDKIGEVGGAVVKGQHDAGIWVRLPIGKVLVECVVQAEHSGGVGQLCHLVAKPVERQVHLRGSAPANTVVGQDDQPGCRQHGIRSAGEPFQSPSGAAGET